MTELSLTDFRQLCEKFSPVKYIYDTDNQIGGKTSDIKMLFFFDRVIVSLAPNCVCFQGDGGNLRLDRVKSIRLYEGVGISDAIIGIDCGNLMDNKEDKTHVISVKKNFKQTL